MLKKYFVLLLISLLVLTSCQSKTDNDGLTVAVSIGPQKSFVEAIAGDLVNVVVMIPPGYSPANYQPSPKEMIAFNEALVYFHLDVPAEVNILSTLDKDDMKLVDLAAISDDHYPPRYFDDDKGIGAHEDGDHEDHEDEDHEDHEDEDHEDEAHEDHEDEDHEEATGHDHDHAGRDPHIWLSPRRVVVMVEEMVEVLSQLDPDNAEVFQSNGQAYIDELVALDDAWTETFEALDHKTFLIYHPSYGYFSDDYDLDMIAIESDGKAATIKDLEGVIDYAKAHDIKAIFYQDEFDSQQAEIIAKEIGGKTIKVSPLSEDYLPALKAMVDQLKDTLD